MLTSYSSVLLLLLVPSFTHAAPSQQLPFSLPSRLSSDSIKSGIIPPLNPANFPKHTLIDLNDGSFVPSPAFGVGSSWYRQNVTEAVLMALENGYRHIGTSVRSFEGSLLLVVQMSSWFASLAIRRLCSYLWERRKCWKCIENSEYSTRTTLHHQQV